MDKTLVGRIRRQSKLTRKEPPKGIDLAKKPGKLSRQDVTCPICWSILFEPTTLPCNHSLCIECFKRHVEETSICCPCCRRRLSIWSRGAAKAQKLVDEPLWNRIQAEFPKLVAARQDGLDSQDILEDELPSLFGERADGYENENVVRPIRDGIISSGQGEVWAEMQGILEEHEKELAIKRQLEEAASAELIQQLLQEEENQRVTIDSSLEEDDFLFAKRLQNKLRREEQRLRIATAPLRSSTRVKRSVRRNLTFSYDNRPNELETSTDSCLSEEHSSTHNTPQPTIKKRKNTPSCTITSEEVHDLRVSSDTTDTSPITSRIESQEKVEKFCEDVVGPSVPNQAFADLFNEIYDSLEFSNGQGVQMNPDFTSPLQNGEFNSTEDILPANPLSTWIDKGEISINEETTTGVLSSSSSPVPPTPNKNSSPLSKDSMSIQLVWNDTNDSINASLAEDMGEMIIGEEEYQFMLLEQEALKARRQRAEQEANDRAFARSMNTKLRLGLPSPTSHSKDSYGLRRSLAYRKENTAENDDSNMK